MKKMVPLGTVFCCRGRFSFLVKKFWLSLCPKTKIDVILKGKYEFQRPQYHGMMLFAVLNHSFCSLLVFLLLPYDHSNVSSRNGIDANTDAHTSMGECPIVVAELHTWAIGDLFYMCMIYVVL